LSSGNSGRNSSCDENDGSDAAAVDSFADIDLLTLNVGGYTAPLARSGSFSAGLQLSAHNSLDDNPDDVHGNGFGAGSTPGSGASAGSGNRRRRLNSHSVPLDETSEVSEAAARVAAAFDRAAATTGAVDAGPVAASAPQRGVFAQRKSSSRLHDEAPVMHK
jgi:hypothetical protein